MNSTMKKCLFLGAAGALALVPAAGAEDPRSRGERPPARVDAPVNANERNADRARLETDADNTAVNVRDRDGLTKTPEDQGGSERDRKLAAQIRRTIVEDNSLSTNAHNVKIIVENGGVTLRGPVNNERERTVIQEIAQRAAGTGSVVNGLELTKPK